MPRENTHLHLANQIIPRLKDEKLRNIINANIKIYNLGSVLHDAFYYTKKEKNISDYLHGKEGNPTNREIIEALDQAKKTTSEKDLSFILGFITHYTFDMTMHPIVYYFSGNYHDPVKTKRDRAIYLHNHLETAWGLELNRDLKFNDLIETSDLKNLYFPTLLEKKFNLKKNAVKNALRKQKIFEFLFTNKTAYRLYRLLNKLNPATKNNFGFFIANAGKDSARLPAVFEYRDLITGEVKKDSLANLYKKSESYSLKNIQTAYQYYLGKITRQDLAKEIRGESLNTGKLNTPNKDIKYTA